MAPRYREALDRALAGELRPWNDQMLGREMRVYRSDAPALTRTGVSRPQHQSDRKPLPVVFALQDRDGFYWVNTAVAIMSLAQYAKEPIEVHVPHDETVSEHAKQR